MYETVSILKPKQYEYRHVVAYMMLFIDGGFSLDKSAPEFKSSVVMIGEKVKASLLSFLRSSGSSTTTSRGPAVKALRTLHKDGELDVFSSRFHSDVNGGLVVESKLCSKQYESVT